MSTQQAFLRAVVYGLVLSALDAVAGRMFRAAPDMSTILPLGAAAWVAYRLATHGQAGIAVPAALALFATYLVGFFVWSTLLIGWNGAVPWRPSTRWLIGFATLAPLVAAAACFVGVRARNRLDVPDGHRTGARR